MAIILCTQEWFYSMSQLNRQMRERNHEGRIQLAKKKKEEEIDKQLELQVKLAIGCYSYHRFRCGKIVTVAAESIFFILLSFYSLAKGFKDPGRTISKNVSRLWQVL